MKERPILFSSEMVRAILDGRKTMTRRVTKPQPPFERWGITKPWEVAAFDIDGHNYKCPYGETGDRLWVRETFIDDVTEGHYLDGTPSGEEHHKIYYRADDITIPGLRPLWRPSIYMPHWASRI